MLTIFAHSALANPWTRRRFIAILPSTAEVGEETDREKEMERDADWARDRGDWLWDNVRL